MSVCAVHRNNTNNVTRCINKYGLPPGGNVTIHFNQLLVADVITISKDGFLTLCEVDVLGTKVVFDPEGQFAGRFLIILNSKAIVTIKLRK